MTGIQAIVSQIATQAVEQQQLAASATGAGPADSGGFSEIFRSAMRQTEELDAKAAKSVTGLLSGDGVEVHEAMIATQKAEMAFELALQVRNKAISAYQQMMQMQF
ncbi:flagellar hook-basal body complex protein FliE [Terriglobus saanensis]|uniref:Flagellar hook-basal body complex protein FliE n=1 Tax=Terriglobus saanensis (strain ATCC BAA-1853 / DSM 23119 / SP1PR4) TaxID=401053 RepID=E8V4Y9_TERSS|nr:flagellar hook-basal body complex protein FliE [Terriglobus saanensis]ADV82617.1 flagellar hook-basal body complex subunit FliE [Terriglobus saanensis SP1PR4]